MPSLSKQARKHIYNSLYENSLTNKSALVEAIRPHYIPNLKKLIEQDLGRIANRMASRVRDEKKCRTVFALEKEGEKTLVNVDNCNDLADLKAIEARLIKERKGRSRSIQKVRQRKEEVAGQLILWQETI